MKSSGVAAALALLLLPTETVDSAADLPDTAGYVNDGYNSDIALQLYISYRASPNTTNKSMTLTEVPPEVQTRLDAAGVSDFSILDGRVQRALLWDSAYTIDPYSRPRRLYTKDGIGLSNLTVSLDEFKAVGCTWSTCYQPDGTAVYNTHFCNGDQFLNASKCATETFTESFESHLTGWSTGGDPNGAPQISLDKNAWVDNGSNISYLIYAVHTMGDNEPEYGKCADYGVYASYAFPCIGKDKLTDDERPRYTVPSQSAWIDTWLFEFADTDADTSTKDGNGDSGFNTLYLIPIAVGVVLLVGIGFIIARRRRNKAARQSQFRPESTIDPTALLSPPFSGVISNANYTKPSESNSTRPTMASDDTLHLSPAQYGCSAYEDASDSRSNSILRALYSDPNLSGKRLPLEQIKMIKALSKGAFGEVWLGELNGEQVAVKRLLQTKQPSFGEFQEFTSEIQLSASLVHPNIIGFIGVAWNSINNLVMVLEFLPGGDLQSHLQRHGDLMSWARDKVHIAIGLARALQYLHEREPSIIHRDLKSKNVLLTRTFEPKLIDFGVSREQKDDMTAGVGTPYWTAPEVLEGTKYSQKSDIFSFGVLLSELDTCKTPYWDAVNAESGSSLKPFQILKEVMAGSLRPSFTADVPDRIRRVADACLQRDPSVRPSAAELVDMLGG